MTQPKIKIIKIEHQRNSTTGSPYYAVLFKGDAKVSRGHAIMLLGIVFDEPGHVAVLPADLRFHIELKNSMYRGDFYESALREAVAKYEQERSDSNDDPA